MMTTDLVPFVFGSTEVLAELPDHIGEQSIVKIHLGALSVENSVLDHRKMNRLSPPRFGRLLNLANGVAYGGGMGMPEWVMLDCALIPSYFAGFMGPAHLLSESQRLLINEGLTTVEHQRSSKRLDVEEQLAIPQGNLSLNEWFPLSEFCAIPRVVPQQIMGYSLYSLKRGLGLRSKAFGLWLWKHLGYEYQVGVAQWTNLAAVRTHLRLGVLELIDPLTSMHTKAGETFIYRLNIPNVDILRSLVESRTEVLDSLNRSVPSEATWKSIKDFSWWLAQKLEYTQCLRLHKIRSTPKGEEVLISIQHF